MAKLTKNRKLAVEKIEEGKLYEIVITQFYGMPLLRYRLGDIIRMVDLKDDETGVSLPQIIFQVNHSNYVP